MSVDRVVEVPGPCPAPIPVEIVDRVLAARGRLVELLPALYEALNEMCDAMSTLLIFEHDELTVHDDELVYWITRVLGPAFDLHQDTADGWYESDAARAAGTRRYALEEGS